LRSSARLRLGAAALLALALAPAARAGLITQTSSLPLTTTDFSPSNSVTGNPLVFQQFDTEGGARTLDGVTLTVHAMIQNQYGMQFTTPATITDSAFTGNPATTGPAITAYQPDGKTPLLTVQASDTSGLSRSVTYGGKPGQTLPQSFSSSLPSTSPFYIAPTVSQQTQTLTVSDPKSLALFTGTGKMSLPVSAAAFSSFVSSSGNGFGSVSTSGTADVTVNYKWHDTIPAPQTVPEPASLVLWGLGGLTLALCSRARRAAA
jgi:hypothetical protein